MDQTILENSLYKKRLRENKDAISFFTPTYNRSQLLSRVYSSLLNQTRKDFVWILVNDGSCDDTEQIAKQFLLKEEIPLLFISKFNGGKHSAFKAALEVTETKYFMCLDDDDLYSEQSTEVLLEEWNRIEKEKKSDIGAIRTLTFDADNDTIMSKPAVKRTEIGQRYDVSSLDRIFKDNILQENWTCYKTEALRQTNLFGSYWLSDQHKFFSEAIWQSRFARRFKCRYYYIVLRTYRRDTVNSLTRAIKTRQYYLDMFINSKLSLDENYDYLKLKKKKLIETVLLVSVLRHKLRIPFNELIKHTNRKSLKWVYFLLFPINCFVIKPIIPSK